VRRYINFKKIFKNIKLTFIFVALLLCTGVSLARAETRTMNYNLNRSLDLHAMADINEQMRLYHTTSNFEQIPPEIRNEAPIPHSQDDLMWLALAIHYEAGSNWLSDEHQLKVGNVVLNRVAHHRFAGTTIYEIVHQPGQYPWAVRTSHVIPSERAIRNAQRLLDGERILPENVVFQAQFRQGSSCHSSIRCDVLRTTTYFCFI